MPKIVKQLTDTQIKSFKTNKTYEDLSDGRGLYLRVRKTGTKSWLFNYIKPHDKKRTVISLGTYPETTLSEARTKRDNSRKLVSKGIDPKLHYQKILDSEIESLNNTFEKVATSWIESREGEVTPDYLRGILKSFQNDIFPAIGQTPVANLTAQSFILAIKPVEERGALDMVRRLCGLINAVMDFAVNSGIVPYNPASAIKKTFKSRKRTKLPTIPPELLPTFLKDLNSASITFLTRCLIEFQLHTMTRPSEACGAEWSEIDFDIPAWIIPAERMKMRREHRIPLTPQVINLLKKLKKVTHGREYLFPNLRNPKLHMSSQTANMAIKRMGYEGKLVSHGLRSLASTILHEQNFNTLAIESALSHLDSNQIRSAYNRSDYFYQRMELMEWWSNHIQKCSVNFNIASAVE